MVNNIAIVSLSSGILGEDFMKFETEIGFQRLKEFGVNVKCMPNALKGMEYIKDHPEKRAEDLLEAFRDPDIDMILCAIGGDDTYRLLPYLFDNDELKDVVNNKIFLGYSDTTINHFMLHKVGINTFYGQAFITDLCELGPEMLPYNRKYFEEHKLIYVFTEDNALAYYIFAAFPRSNTRLLELYDFTYASGCQNFLDEIYDEKSMNKLVRDGWEHAVTPENFIITLSTQNRDDPSRQTVVVGCLVGDASGTIDREMDYSDPESDW